MNKWLLSICIGCWLTASSSYAQTAPQATISWTPNQEPDIAGYRVYQSTASKNYGTAPAFLLPSTRTTITISLPQLRCNARYFWTVTAFDFGGHESVKSVEVSKTIVGTRYWIGACKKQ